MALRKLDSTEKQILSDKIQELQSLHKKAMGMDAKSYTYDWMQLDRDLTKALLVYRHIINQSECLEPESIEEYSEEMDDNHRYLK